MFNIVFRFHLNETKVETVEFFNFSHIPVENEYIELNTMSDDRQIILYSGIVFKRYTIVNMKKDKTHNTIYFIDVRSYGISKKPFDIVLID